MIPRFPALELFAQFGGDLAIDDPVRVAAMYEARARDAFHEAEWNARNGHQPAADVFERAAREDMQRAAEVLASALQSERRDATA